MIIISDSMSCYGACNSRCTRIRLKHFIWYESGISHIYTWDILPHHVCVYNYYLRLTKFYWSFLPSTERRVELRITPEVFSLQNLKKRYKSHPKSFYDSDSSYDVREKQCIFCSVYRRSSLTKRKDFIRRENKTSATLCFVFEGHLPSHELHLLPTCLL